MTLGHQLRNLAWAGTVALFASISGCGEESAPAAKPPVTEPPKGPIVTQPKAADWCKEHVVPESICTRCNKDLIADFKKKNDWCKEHDLPESQCTKCHPDLEAKFKAMAPK